MLLVHLAANTVAESTQPSIENHAIVLEGGGFKGTLTDNVGVRVGSGFQILEHERFPGHSLYRNGDVGLNFEHIFNGSAADKALSMFTPRKDNCVVSRSGARQGAIRWAADQSAWAMDCELVYSLDEPDAVDLAFACTPREQRYPLGYAAMMWASYMNHARERRIHFWGVDGDKEGWISFGDATGPEPGDIETGTVRCRGVEPLAFEKDAQTLNIVEHPSKQFILPFYYGLYDGDGDYATQDDTMAYVMMFDQDKPIRFAMWNFIQNEAKEPDTHSPAWDWQFVLHHPQPGQTYRYKARMMYLPFVSADEIRALYERWAAPLAAHR